MITENARFHISEMPHSATLNCIKGNVETLRGHLSETITTVVESLDEVSKRSKRKLIFKERPLLLLINAIGELITSPH